MTSRNSHIERRWPVVAAFDAIAVTAHRLTTVAETVRWPLVVLAVSMAILCMVGYDKPLRSISQAQAIHGYMYSVPLAGWEHAADTAQEPRRSVLSLAENGKSLGPAHSSQASIAAEGRGRYAHVGEQLYFSASDNSDPRTNGRKYDILRTAFVNQGYLVLTGLLAGLGWRKRLIGFLGVLAADARLARLKQGLAASIGLRGAAFRARSDALLAMFALGFVLALGAQFISWHVFHPLPAGTIAHIQGQSYYAPLAELGGFADSNDRPNRSTLVVLEDGRPLGPGHSLHSVVAEAGRGRYSHYSGGLYFSSSDLTDPRQNGRRYKLRYDGGPSRLWPVVFGIGLAALLARRLWQSAGGLGRLRQRHVVEALRASGIVPLSAMFGASILLAFLFLVVAAPDRAAVVLSSLRECLQWIVACGVALAGSALLVGKAVPRSGRDAGLLVLRAVALTILVHGIVERYDGYVPSRELDFAYIMIAGAGAMVVMWRLWPVMGERAEAWLDGLSLRCHVVVATAVCVVLTFFQVVPEVVQYWDQSGWMDSAAYDKLAHDIARGTQPFGSSEYAPVYQYGMAVFYWAFGHLFFIQQVVNVALALATVALMSVAAGFYFRSAVAVWYAGLFSAHAEVLHHAVWYTQIENWYVPAFALSLVALGNYFARPDARAMSWLAAAAALVFGIRLQGAFYCAALGLAALCVRGLFWRTRVAHLAVFGVVFVTIAIVPWSLRNWYVDGKFSPSSAQSSYGLALLNDPRVPFYGIRYWENIYDVSREWIARYPGEGERLAAMRSYFASRLRNDPDYFVRAVPWRTAAFYGLLPQVVFEKDGEQRLSLNENVLPHLAASTRFWLPIGLSLLGLLVSWRRRESSMLLLLLAANLSVVLFAGFGEPRLCYPVMLLHLLMGLAVVAPFTTADTAGSGPGNPRALKFAGITVASAAIALLTGRGLVGQSLANRPIIAATWRIESNVTIDRTLPLVEASFDSLFIDGQAAERLELGRRYRSKMRVTNRMFPPKYVTGLEGMLPRLSSPGSVQYFESDASPKTRPRGLLGWDKSQYIPIRFDGVLAEQPLIEGSLVEVELQIDAISQMGVQSATTATVVYWSRIEKAVLLKEPE